MFKLSLLSFQRALRTLIRSSQLQHTLFWALSYYVLLRFFAYDNQLNIVDAIYTFLFHISLAFVVYLNIRWLFPRYFSRQRYLIFILGLAVLVVAGAWLNMVTFNYLTDWLFPGFYFISYYEFRDIVQFTLVYAVLSTLLKLSKGWFQLRQQEQRLTRLEREKTDAELRALRMQLDPHFLFNNLNSLYSLSLDSDPRVPELVLKLSQGLRYMLYESREPYVSLEQELVNVHNYLDLQRLRYDGQVDIRLEQHGEASERRVAPLLFLPLIENAFKHGVRGGGYASFVHLDFELGPPKLIFRVQNSKRPPATELPIGTGGIGLDNIRRRLHLLYPNRHRLDIRETDAEFSVTLEIDLP